MIRKAKTKDISRIGELLIQVNLVHYNARPDIFKKARKYNDEEVADIINDKNRPILVAVDENDDVTGYCFCVFEQHKDSALLTDIKTLYIDDLCVDEKLRGKGIGKKLYNAAVQLAKTEGCYNITLNVWGGNDSALKFYESLGLKVQKTGMEYIL